jgi:hypothetical protein
MNATKVGGGWVNNHVEENPPAGTVLVENPAKNADGYPQVVVVNIGWIQPMLNQPTQGKVVISLVRGADGKLGVLAEKKDRILTSPTAKVEIKLRATRGSSFNPDQPEVSPKAIGLPPNHSNTARIIDGEGDAGAVQTLDEIPEGYELWDLQEFSQSGDGIGKAFSFSVLGSPDVPPELKAEIFAEVAGFDLDLEDDLIVLSKRVGDDD